MSTLFRVPDALGDFMAKVINGDARTPVHQLLHQIADSTVQSTATANHLSSFVAAQPTPPVLGAAIRDVWNGATEPASPSMFSNVLHLVGRVKNFGGIFSYMTSKWALSTFVVAIVLNRTQFYASSRRNLRLRMHVRLTLYLIPILALVSQIVTLLQALKCQTSPDYPLYRYSDPSQHHVTDFAGDGGFLHVLSSTLLFWQDDAASCAAQRLSTTDDAGNVILRGSASLLYRFFLTLCAGQLFETLSCAVQGRLPMSETGMTIFEHSLAFAECEAMLSSALGLGSSNAARADGVKTLDGLGSLVSRADMIARLNVPPEVLLVCLISCFSHLSSAVLAVLGIRHRYRLVNTSIWACSYISAFAWIFVQVFFGPMETADLGILRFPTVCVVGFIPHVLILLGIVICASIYGFAMLITAMSIPSEVAQGLTISERLAWAYGNLQANVQFSQNSAIRIKMSEDFYTTLLKVGFHVLTAASEAVYLNEGSHIQVANMTWLEQKRIDDLAAGFDRRRSPAVPPELLDDGIARGMAFVDQHNTAIGPSPYACERKSKPAQTDAEKTNVPELDSGLGISQRRSRMHLTLEFIGGILRLLASVQAQMALNMLGRLGIAYRPSWLLKAAGASVNRRPSSTHSDHSSSDSLDFYMIGPDGNLSLPHDDDVDVEAETRQRLLDAGTYQSEEQLSDNLYGWWRSGGWFGNRDDSGDYEASGNDDDDDDVTSLYSMSTTASVFDDTEASGQRTPTLRSAIALRSREPTPAPVDDLTQNTGLLARLLNPQTLAERDEARLLSYSLQSDRPMTRSQYRRAQDLQRAELLRGLRNTHSRASPSSSSPSPQPWGADDEERELEHFVLSQRSKHRDPILYTGTNSNGTPASANSTSWDMGADGMGADGPQCVVCQSAPRTVLVWPCGCLSMCDDCRLGLAARNYTQCICCRTEIVAYSRMYVP